MFGRRRNRTTPGGISDMTEPTPAPRSPDGSNIPVPDPSTLTNEAVDKAVETLKELFESKFEALQKDLDNFKAGHEEKHTSVVAAAIQHRRELSDAQTGSVQASMDLQFRGVEERLKEQDRRYQERFEAQNLALTAALDARQKAVEAALSAQVKAVESALDAKEKSTAKAEEVLEHRFAGIAEFRSQLQRENESKNREIKELMSSLEKLTDAKFEAVRVSIAGQAETVQLALASAERAAAKAGEAAEKRFDVAAAIQSQLAEQTAMFMPRSEAETRWIALADKVEDLKGLSQLTLGRASAQPTTENRLTELTTALTDLNTRFASAVGRDSGSQLDRRFDELIKQVDQLRLTQIGTEGKSQGLNAGWVYLLGALAAMGTIVSLFVAFNN
jgi:hypothetical protein